jgi:hypothetical protein
MATQDDPMVVGGLEGRRRSDGAFNFVVFERQHVSPVISGHHVFRKLAG